MTRRRRPGLRRAVRRSALVLIAITITIALALTAVPDALAAAGGGSSSFHSGGGGGFGGGGFGGGGGGHGKGFAIYLIFRALFDIALLGHGLGLLVILLLVFAVWFMSRGLPRLQAYMHARRQQGRRAGKDTRRRQRRVELAAAEAADEDPIFDPDSVRAAAGDLFAAVQRAWDANDRIALRGLVAADLLAEWERRLDDFDTKGWRNRIEVQGPTNVEYVGIDRNDNRDRVTVRIEARLRDYVTDRAGRHVKRAGSFTETVRLREFWTLQRRSDHWVLASIEQGAEGAHALRDKIVQTEWADEQRLRDEAMVEGAVADAVPSGTNIADLTDLQFTGDARAAALDLSLADGRFAPDVLEIAARRATAAWVEAVDGPDDELRRVADAGAVLQLLHPGDPSGRTRVVVRGAEVRQIRVAALDAAAEPPTMTIEVDLKGRRYLEDRDTAQVLAGNPAKAIEFTERWTFAVTGDPTTPWRIVSVSTSAVPA